MRRKVVEIRNLEYTYPDGTRALRRISLDMFEPECVALMGPNGSGSSTILLLLNLNGILQEKNGEVIRCYFIWAQESW